MRTNIEINDQLVRRAMRSSGARSKKAAGEAGLQPWWEPTPRQRSAGSAGKVRWEGDLSASRRSQD